MSRLAAGMSRFAAGRSWLAALNLLLLAAFDFHRLAALDLRWLAAIVVMTCFNGTADQHCCQTQNQTQCSHDLILQFIPGLSYQPFSAIVKENTSRHRGPLKTPAHPMFSDRNLSNKQPIFSEMVLRCQDRIFAATFRSDSGISVTAMMAFDRIRWQTEFSGSICQRTS